MAPHSSTLAWKIPWMEEPGRLQSMGSLKVGHDWATSLSLFTFMHWRRKWQPTPVFLPGESQGRGEPGGLPSVGSHRVRHDWSDLAAAAAAAENKIIRFYWSTAVFYVLVCLYRLGWKLLNNREHVGDNKHHEEKQGRVSSWSVILGCTVGEPSLRWWCWVHLDEVKM